MTTEFYLTLTRGAQPDAIAGALGEGLEALGYERYDPFPGGKGPARIWKDKVTAFIAPPREGWTCIAGRVPAEAIAKASAELDAPLLHLWLTGDMWGYLLFAGGDDLHDVEALADFVRPGRTLDDVQRALTGELDGLPLDPAEVEDESALPGNVIALAADHDVDMEKAQQMIDKWNRRIFGRLGKKDKEAAGARTEAEAMLQGEPSIWGTHCGKRLRAFAAALAMPAGWHQPAFEVIRDAYTVARRRQQNPNATLLPSDEQALARLPGAADYLPVYYGTTRS
jgi:hypothetical protein